MRECLVFACPNIERYTKIMFNWIILICARTTVLASRHLLRRMTNQWLNHVSLGNLHVAMQTGEYHWEEKHRERVARCPEGVEHDFKTLSYVHTLWGTIPTWTHASLEYNPGNHVDYVATRNALHICSQQHMYIGVRMYFCDHLYT